MNYFRMMSYFRICAVAATLLLAACAGGTPEERLQRAIGYQSDGRNQAAILELRSALQQDPEMAEARLLLGELFLEIGDASAAVVELERAERLGVTHRELSLTLAQARVASGETRHARRVLATLGQIEANELSAPLTTVLGRAHLSLGEIERARELLTASAAREPLLAQAWLGLARLEMVEGNQVSALRHAEEAFRLDPDILEAAMTLGALRLATGDAARAGEVFEAATALAARRQATTAYARMGSARALMATNDYTQARLILAQVLRDSPTFAEANYLQAWAHMHAEEYAQAKPHLERVLQELPDHQDSRYLLALIAFREDRNDQARDALARIVARTPGDRRARLLLAEVHARQGMHDEAVRVLRAGLLEDGSEPDAAFKLALGQSLMRSGKREEGVAMLAQAAEAAPEAADIRTQLALAQLASGASSAAEAELRAVAELSEGFAPPDLLLIFMLIEAGRFDEALDTAERLTRRYPDDATAFNVLGAAHLANGDADAARRATRRALELDADFAPAAVNLALLEAQAGDMATARHLLAAVLARHPGHRSATIALADLAHAQGDLESTRRAVDDAWSADQGNVELSLRLANLLSREGEHDRALEVLAGLGSHADVADAVLTARVVAGRRAERLEESIAALETLLLRHPKDEGVLLALAQTLLDHQQIEPARELLADHLRDPGATGTPLLLLHAQLLLHHESWTAAEAVLNVLSQRDDAKAASEMLQGDLAFRRGRAETAILHYQTVHGLQPSQAALRRLQAARRAAGRPELGRSELTAWVAEHPDDNHIRTMLAELHLGLGEFEQSIQHYEVLTQRAPDNPALLNNLAWLYGRTGHAGALDTARRAHQLAPDLAPVQDTLGWLLLQQGNVEEAHELLRQAAANSPEDPDIQYHFAVALKRSGESAEARELLRSLMEQQFDSASEARQLYEQLGSL